MSVLNRLLYATKKKKKNIHKTSNRYKLELQLEKNEERFLLHFYFDSYTSKFHLLSSFQKYVKIFPIKLPLPILRKISAAGTKSNFQMLSFLTDYYYSRTKSKNVNQP